MMALGLLDEVFCIFYSHLSNASSALVFVCMFHSIQVDGQIFQSLRRLAPSADLSADREAQILLGQEDMAPLFIERHTWTFKHAELGEITRPSTSARPPLNT
jgi:hypothetical protein